MPVLCRRSRPEHKQIALSKKLNVYMERIGAIFVFRRMTPRARWLPMSGMGEDNALYFAFGMATGVALLWFLARTIMLRL
jgi:hypothetical protein